MRTFACRRCGQLVFFENTACLNCGAELGIRWDDRELLTLTPTDDGTGTLAVLGHGGGDGEPFYRCQNFAVSGCNAVVHGPGSLCPTCLLTRTRPDTTDPDADQAFREAEAAKRRLVFELGELRLPVTGYRDQVGGLGFDMLSSRDTVVMTGHSGGIITLDLAESDDVRRVQRQEQLDEPYRTVLGHLRHEVGHYYFPILTRYPDALAQARQWFGDEREDYGAALDRHYEQGPPWDWAERHVSAYATMHPSEDWAETFAHYLHIRDTLQTAASHGVQVLGPEPVARLRPDADLVSLPQDSERPFDALISAWLPLTYALNALNRSMGRDDLYPFVLAGPVLDKLAVVHELVGRAARG